MSADEPHSLVVIDRTPGVYGELLADVEVVCKETGQRITLTRGRYVVVEESVLKGTPRVEGEGD